MIMATVIELRPDLWPQAMLHAGGSKRRPARRSAARDPHVDWLRRCFDERNRCNHTVDEADGDAHFDEALRLEKLLENTPASSLEGVIARLAQLVDRGTVHELPPATLLPVLHNALELLGIDNWEAQ